MHSNIFLGVVLITGALVADAIIGNVQEKQMKLYKASNVEVVNICTCKNTKRLGKY